GFGLVRQRLHQVRRIDEPALDRVGLAADRGVADGGGDALVGERVDVGVGAVEPRLVVFRVPGQRIRRDLNALAYETAALAAVVAQQRIDQRDGAAALRVVAVPVDAATGVDDAGRAVAGEFARRGADQVGRHVALLGRPLHRIALDLGRELVEAVAVLL